MTLFPNRSHSEVSTGDRSFLGDTIQAITQTIPIQLTKVPLRKLPELLCSKAKKETAFMSLLHHDYCVPEGAFNQYLLNDSFQSPDILSPNIAVPIFKNRITVAAGLSKVQPSFIKSPLILFYLAYTVFERYQARHYRGYRTFFGGRGLMLTKIIVVKIN